LAGISRLLCLHNCGVVPVSYLYHFRCK
jgi:hypothetical protein